MTSSPNLRFTPESRADLRAIARYTKRTWGKLQRDVYMRMIRAKIADLQSFPLIGVQRDDVGNDVRSLLVGQHLVLYRYTAAEIIILRVLHSRMDTLHQFDPES